jgi:hypothetical protein
MILTGCGDPSSQEQVSTDVAAAEPASSPSFCRQLTSSSGTADLLLQAAFASTPEGAEAGGGALAESLAKQGGYRFLGAEPLGDACWAYAELKGTMWEKPFHLRWRCAVKAYREDPARTGAAVLEMVDNRICDFNVDRGDPAQRPVELEAMKL